MKPEQRKQESGPRDGGQSPAPEGDAMPLVLSVPVWDITDEQIEEWKQSRSGIPAVRLAGYTAAAIRNGEYDNGREMYPLGTPAYQEVTRETVDHAMEMLMERGMTRRSGGRWYPNVPGRMEPSTWRAVATLLDRRADLPPALTAELESWKLALHALNAPGGAAPGQAAPAPAARPATPALAVAAG
jgi:hypothetical protein